MRPVCRLAVSRVGRCLGFKTSEFGGETEPVNLPAETLILKELAEAGGIRAAIDRQYPLEKAAEAHAYVDSGHRRGTVVLTMEE